MVKKSQFAGLNDKINFSDGMCSLPYGHYILNDIRNKKKKYKHIHQHVQQIKVFWTMRISRQINVKEYAF